MVLLRPVWFLLALSAVLISTLSVCGAQTSSHSDPALFLEPNHFTIVKELADRALWIEVGYGKDLVNIGKTQIGLEGLAWSRLEMISNFRFPLETIDYFFGAYATWPTTHGDWRLRISHISSHLADGTDTTIVGGASSRYSREFIELRRAGDLAMGTWGRLYGSLGVRAYFHQVTKIENSFSFPACLVWEAFHSHDNQLIASAFASTGSGPVWPCFSAGIRIDHPNPPEASLDFELYYQYGASWAGTDAGARRSTINLQMDVRGF